MENVTIRTSHLKTFAAKEALFQKIFRIWEPDSVAKGWEDSHNARTKTRLPGDEI